MDGRRDSRAIRRQLSFKFKALLSCVILSAVIATSYGMGPAGQYSKTDYSYRAMDIGSLRRGFAEPPIEAGPWVYWFCFDNAITSEEMKREIREMVASGIAGAELRFVEFAWWRKNKEEVDNELAMAGHKRLEYLSDDFLEVLEEACGEAERHGFKLSINMGMGWPPGGTWITDGYRSRKLESKVIIAEGAKRIGEEMKVTVPLGAKVYAWQLEEGKEKGIVRDSFVNLSEHVRIAGKEGGLFWEVPHGRWLVVVYWVGYGGKLDKAYGYPADPGSKEAIEFHLNHLLGKIEPKLGKYFGTTLTEVASDSWEYDGRPYWTEAIDEAFLKLNGYELSPRMYAMAGYGEDREKILADIDRAEQRLVLENFFICAREKLNSYGLAHRPQAYGRGLSRDLFEVYSNCDVPEIEEGVYCPEAVWVSHTLCKPIASVEGMTFLSRQSGNLVYPFSDDKQKGYSLDEGRGSWETNPAMLRWYSNAHYARGINRLQIHSFGYSPEGVPLPGWRMYAEIHLNRNVSWWPYMKEFSRWSRRVQWILQSGWPVADSLVYPVESDPADGPHNKQSERQPVSAVNSTDAASKYTFGRIWENNAPGYDVQNLCLVSDIETLHEAEKIQQMLSRGVKVTYCSEEPAKWTVFKDRSDKAARAVLKSFEKSMRQGRLVDGRNEGWQKAVENGRSVRWYPEDSLLTYLHRRVKGGEVYFLMNWGEDFDGEAEFGQAGLVPQIWDADSGKIEECGQWKVADGRIRVKMRLGRLESGVVVLVKAKPSLHAIECKDGMIEREDGKLYAVLDGEKECQVQLSDGRRQKLRGEVPAEINLAEGWTLSVSDKKGVGVKGELKVEVDKLVSWRQISHVGRYSGIGTYSIAFDVGPEILRDDLLTELDLGKVYEAAEVWLNGKRVGVSWYRPYKVDITGYLKQGRNELRVDVANILKNYLTEVEYSHPSGLLGPVKIRGIARLLLNQ